MRAVVCPKLPARHYSDLVKPAPTKLATALWATMILASCNSGGANAQAQGTDPEEDQPPLVKVQNLEIRQVRREIEASAFLASEFEVTLTSKIPGRVVEVLVDEGQEVKKGALLARMDDREARAAKKQVELQLAERKLRKDLAEWEAKAAAHRVVRAGLERDQANAQYQRLSKLDPDVVPPKELEDAKFALDGAAEALKESELNLQKAGLDISVAKQAIEEAEARLEESQARLADHELRSPMDGIIAKREVDSGEAISTSIAHALFEIVDPRNLVSYLKRPQLELPLVKHAKSVIFTTDAYPDMEFTGRVDMVSPIVDPATGSFQIRIRVPTEDTRLLVPGMFIRARILTEENRRALMVPKTAVLAEGD
ncbi:MAG: efflux RND transporter periplasmic adaptor subunit, partial [Planctomycetota bacterium]